MNSKKVITELRKLSKKNNDIEKMIVYSYIKMAQIEYADSKLLANYFIDANLEMCNSAYILFSKQSITLSMEDLVELFEHLISESDKKENGIVYTPLTIRQYIIQNSIHGNIVPTFLDPTCGCGAFLVTVANELHKKYNLSYREIYTQKLFGVDLDKNAIRKSKLLLELLACSNGEYEECGFNLICANMLDPQTTKKLKKLVPKNFDCVIGNPPYVRHRNISERSKQFLNNWKTSAVGNVDLYMPFFEIGISLLSKDGVLGFITPNSFIQSVNGRKLRSYLIDNNYPIEIIDFRDVQIFKGVTSYTCITHIRTNVHSSSIQYVRLNDENTLFDHHFSNYNSSLFHDGKPWRIREASIDSVIEKLENTGTKLSHWKIRNGLATLKNDIFFFKPDYEDETYFYRTYQQKKFAIEKEICIKVAKPNIIKNETELSENIEQAIFPYEINGNCSIIEEQELAKRFPKTYKFLSVHRNDLDNRDKGNGDYPAWYAYGRTQGMNNFGKKLLLPYIAGKPIAVLSLDERLLFYCGYAIISDDEEELRVLKCFLESDAFWYYIFHTSKPYSKGYMAFAKNYIINFSIPNLSKQEIDFLLSCNSKDKMNAWIWNKYGIEKIV